MPRKKFQTIPPDLLGCADQCVDHFGNGGHTISIEKNDFAFPYTPSFVAKRGPTTIIVEVMQQVVMSRVEDWVRYAKSSGRDTRLVVCVPGRNHVAEPIETKLRDAHVGVHIVENGHITELLIATDLALNVNLPPLNTLPPRLRQLLGAAYDNLNGPAWRDGYQEACRVLETEARRYFIKNCGRNRITIVTRRRGAYTPTQTEVNGLTMGQLRDYFSKIQSPNRADTIIENVLTKVRADRNRLAHGTRTASEGQLRKNVGQNLYRIITALKEIIAAP